MTKDNGDTIGTIRKIDLLNLILSHRRLAIRLGADSAYGDALEDIAIATGLGESIRSTQFSEPQKLSVTVEGQVKRLNGGDEN